METMGMSVGERRRLELLSRVRDGELTLSKAAESMGVSYRQAKRIWSRYRVEGDAGLVHRLRGRASNRRSDESEKEAVLAAYQERYSDFGPTLASEYLAREEGLEVAVETLRQWLRSAGLWQRRRKASSPHRRWRPRKEHRGELVQLDGSHHDWFEGRRGKAVLMVLIDDATGTTFGQFFEGETTAAVFELFGAYSRKYGLPQAVYPDRHSIHHTTRDATVDESLAGAAPDTQFGRALRELGVNLILAGSPQAKGRVERCNGTLQDRLVKALRLKGISDLESANRFLAEEFLADFNERFGVAPAAKANLHRRIPRGVDLDRVLSFQEPRVVRNDGTLQWRNRWFQLTGPRRPRPKARVLVCEAVDGRVRVFHGSRELSWEELPERPPSRRSGTPEARESVAAKKSKQEAKSKQTSKTSRKPSAEHPWRRRFVTAEGPSSIATVVGGGSAPAR